MKTTISHASQFRDAFHQAGRDSQFSYEALNMLYEYFEDVDPDMELDVVAICCDYTEDTVEGIADAYGLELPEDETEEEHRQAVFDYLSDHTSVVGDTSDGFVYANF
jgi:hypothetical protein